MNLRVLKKVDYQPFSLLKPEVIAVRKDMKM